MKIEYVQQQHQTLLNYLQLCVTNSDWHGVRDAAVDIEILEARYPALRPELGSRQGRPPHRPRSPLRNG